MSLPQLSGIVAKGSAVHKHNWQTTHRRQFGVIFKLHVCTEHHEPVIKAFDMEVVNPGMFRGDLEYRSKRI